jgi:uncharacterized OB-fold protein
VATPADVKFQPRITPATAPFFAALREKKFITTRCTRCAAVSFPPRLICPACMSDEREWVELSGRGAIYAFTFNRIVPRAYIAEAPYITAMVDLAEGPRILTRLEHSSYEDLAIGQAVRVGFKPLSAEIMFFYFEPVR